LFTLDDRGLSYFTFSAAPAFLAVFIGFILSPEAHSVSFFTVSRRHLSYFTFGAAPALRLWLLTALQGLLFGFETHPASFFTHNRSHWNYFTFDATIAPLLGISLLCKGCNE
jgi:apolipoprotein N-acyltransferase